MEVFLLFIFTLEPVLAYNPHPSLAFRFNGILAVTATVNCIALPVRCTLSIQCKWQLCLSFRVFHTKCELRIKYICDERERELAWPCWRFDDIERQNSSNNNTCDMFHRLRFPQNHIQFMWKYSHKWVIALYTFFFSATIIMYMCRIICSLFVLLCDNLPPLEPIRNNYAIQIRQMKRKSNDGRRWKRYVHCLSIAK